MKWFRTEQQICDFLRLHGQSTADVGGVPYHVVEFTDDETGELLARRATINIQELARFLTDSE